MARSEDELTDYQFNKSDDDEIIQYSNQIKSEFTTLYLHLMGLVQAAVLGYLLLTIGEHWGSFTVSNILLSIVTFIAILIVWFEYMIGSPSFRWIPRFTDALIPFLFVITQFFLVHSIWGPLYLYCLAIVAVQFNAVWSYYNMYESAKKYPENDKAFNLLGNLPNQNMIVATLSGIGFIIFGIISFVFQSNLTIQLAISTIAVVAAIGYIYYVVSTWNAVVNKIERKEAE